MEVRKFAWQPVLILIPQPHEPLRSPRCLRGPPPQVSSLEEVLDSPSKSFLPSASSPPMVPRGHGGGGGGGGGRHFTGRMPGLADGQTGRGVRDLSKQG